MTVIVTTSPLAIVQVAVAGTEPADGLPPEIVTVGATVYPEPPSVILILYNTPSLYSVDWILPVDGEPVNTLPIVNASDASTANPRNKLVKSLFKMNDCGDPSTTSLLSWIAISPASAPSIESLSASFTTVKILNGLNAGIWSREILPESVSSTSALGTAFVEYGLLMYGPREFVI